MRILADGGPFLTPPSGIARYVEHVVAGFVAEGAAVDVVTFGGPLQTPLPAGARRRRRPKILGTALRRARRLGLALPVDLVAGGPADAYFFGQYERWPVIGRGARAVVIYDLAYALHPDVVDAGVARWLRRVVPQAVADVDVVVAISDAGAAELAGVLGVPAARIVVAPPAVDVGHFARPSDDAIDTTLRRHGLERGYFFFCGNLEPRKNLVRLLDAWSALPAPRRPLVVVGARGWRDDAIRARIEALARDPGLRLLGRVSDDELPALYAGAHALAFPSLYEGFGIPILEAMACGCPVLTANRSSMPEVAGGAAVLVDPFDVDDIARGLQVLAGEAEEPRQHRVRAGLDNVRRYDWRSSSRVILDALRAARGR